MSTLAEMQYRVNFLVSLLQALISIVASLVVLALVFSQASSLKRLDLQEAEDGTLDFMFTKPIDAQLVAATRAFGVWQGTDILVGAVVLGIAAGQLHGDVTLLGVLGFVLGPSFALVMIDSFLCILEIRSTPIHRRLRLKDATV